jgi:dipeptidyl-peptidase-4
LELLLADSQNGTTRLLLEEKETEYVAEMLFDNLTFLKDGKHFIWSSERDDWHHLYLFDMQGQLVRPLTSGNWEVTNFYGVDETRGLVYYQAAKVSPMQREIYSVKTDGSDTRLVMGKPGWNNAQFSSTFDYYVLNHATINSPATYTVFDQSGKELRVIEDNAALRQKMGDYGFVPAEFFSFTTSENVSLNGYMLKPANMEEGKEYPVFMFLYGGPGSQQVTDNWGGDRFAWFQMLVQQGFIVACVDNRGTGARGEAFKKMTYLQMGKYETMDQIEAAKYLGGLPYADAARIGIFGWSYGGYMSSLCLLKGNDVFNAAIAVAPVTSWRWYDSIYTERFMRTEKENPEGYAQNSPVYFADQLKGNYLLVHGNSDDNVHFQHTAEMANALIKANKQFDTYFYPNRNHGIYGDNARLHLYTKMTNFLQQHLKSASSHISAKP